MVGMAKLIVYSSSCLTCRQNAMHMARLTALYGSQNIKVVDTRVEQEQRPEHARIAAELELPMDRLKPVVHIQENGENIYKPLSEV